ncbi:DUF2975 domain-containing protein [Bacteroides sp.]|uniref:DUF2975 domain-containing protein n=1 Tax=Bacteroides sp. TaxID=29523 RepID=UPI0023D3AEB4|nr:DUF2975 domain-containing protein [Bacteroides sp.]MDE5760192.1 DUF2975 domain-containing protein [Bacteroides sp.]MDE6215323.1 DUF2975 domain-containing protein [Bacteroides sp.]
MRMIKLLALLVVLFWLGDTFLSWWDFAAGYNDAMISRDPVAGLRVRPIAVQECDSVFNKVLERKVECAVSSVRVGVKPSSMRYVQTVVTLLVCLFFLYGCWCIFRLIMRVLRGEVFTRENVRRMRFFVYSTLLLYLMMEVNFYMDYHLAASQVELTDFAVLPYSPKYIRPSYLLLALFTEIFAVGVKMKEEQDLTI